MKAKEVKKKLALLLCAAMVLTMMPSSAFSALAELLHWEVKSIEVSVPETIEAGKSAIVEVKATKVATAQDATIVASDSEAAIATAPNALKAGHLTFNPDIFEVGPAEVKNGALTYEVIANNTIKTNTSVTLTFEYNDCKYTATTTVVPATEPPVTTPVTVTSMTFKEKAVTLKVGEKRDIEVAFGFSKENATVEEKDAAFESFWADNEAPEAVGEWTAVYSEPGIATHKWQKLEDIKDYNKVILTITGQKAGTTKLTSTYKYKDSKTPITASCDITVVEAAIASAQFDQPAVNVGKDGATVKLTVAFNKFTTDAEKADLWKAFYEEASKTARYDDKVIHINWKNDADAYTAEIGIEAISKDTTDLTVQVGDIAAICKVTVTEAPLRISGMRFEKDTLEIEKDEPTKIKMFIDYSDKDAKEDEKKAVFEKFWTGTDGKWIIDMDPAVVDVEFPPYFGVSDYNVIRVTITGKMAGQTKLDVVYDGQYAVEKLSAVVDITVNGNNEVEVVPVSPSIEEDAIEGEGVTEEQENAIKDEIAKGTATLGAINTAALLEEIPLEEGQDVLVEPKVTVQKINVVLEDGKAVVESMEADIDVQVYVVDKDNLRDPKGSLTKYFDYVTVNVPVPASRPADSNYVEWMHQVNGEWGYTDLVSTGSYISNGTAQLVTRSFSPFRMTFVHRETSSGGNYNGHTSSSTKKTTSAGQWKRAADGVRWWYEYSNGTWPANGWAQLVWNGKTDWYYFDAEGYMVTGWVTWEGNRYYLHPISDDTQGHMYTGWQPIDGKWYYFRPESGGPQGSLFVNGTTPDGYTVDANGAWIQ